ncbi:MAG: chromosome segregation ATPase, partial [Porticoccaceae bacterium]
MSEQIETHGNTVRSIRPVRQVLVIEPVQQHHGLHAILLLPGTQCTIGSSRACTLTVRAQAILPQHCLIVSGANSTLLKEWGDSTWLNDRPVRESMELMENDRLAIGPTEFRIRQANAEEVDAAFSNNGDDDSIDEQLPTEELNHQRALLTAQQKRLAGEAEGLDSREQKLLDREKELNTRFQELDEQFKSLCERTGAPESGDLDDQLRALQGDGDALKAERDELEKLRQELDDSRADQSKREDDFKERERDLDRHRAALANQELDLEHRRNEFRQREEAAEQLHDQYAEQEKAVEARRKEFDDRQKELDEQREAIETLREQLSEQGDWSDGELSSAQKLIDADREELVRHKTQMERERRDLEARQKDFELKQKSVSYEVEDAERRVAMLMDREQRLAEQDEELRHREGELDEQLILLTEKSSTADGEDSQHEAFRAQLHRLAESLRKREETLRNQ